MASVLRRPRWVAVRPSGPAELAPLLRPPPDGRCARHATARSGAARCGQGGCAPSCDWHIHLWTAPRSQRLKAKCRRDISTALGASTVVRGVSRSAAPGGGHCIPAAAAGQHQSRTEGATGGTGRTHSESCRPAGSALRRMAPAARRAESRSPQRGRRAGDSITQGAPQRDRGAGGTIAQDSRLTTRS
jgi:hypothetical protein